MLPLPPVASARRHERGLFVVLVAVLAVVLFGLVGLAVDASHVQATGGQLQHAADAAALAAAARVHAEANAGGSGGSYVVTRKAAIDCAALNVAEQLPVQLHANSVNDPAGDVVVGRWDGESRTFTPTLSKPNAVKVTARLTEDVAAGSLQLSFGSLFGVSSSDVLRSAIAASVSEPNALIHVLDPTAKGALKLSGTANLNVPDGKVQVDSSNSCAISVNGNPTLSAAKTTVHGKSCAPTDAILGELEQEGPTEADPLAGILPTPADWNAVKGDLSKPLGGAGKITSSGIYAPGYYPNGLDITNTTAVTLLPGTYMFGDDVSMNGQSLVTAGAGVTLLLDKGAKLSVGGGASLLLTPPASGPFAGLTIMFHRETTGGNVCDIGGGGSISFLGTLYCPGGEVDLGGTGAMQAFGQIVCDTLSCSGTPTITGDSIVPPKNAGPVSLVQ